MKPSNLCHEECFSTLSSINSCLDCLSMNESSSYQIPSTLNYNFTRNTLDKEDYHIRSLQSKCYDQNCINCTFSSNICNQCTENYQLLNTTCKETQVSPTSMLIIILGIVVPVIFTIAFCIM